MKPGFALDQHDCAWIVFERNGDMWAMGYTDDEACIRRLFDDNLLQTNLTKPHAYRRLELVAIRRADDGSQ